jgi:hypothetical protein
MDTNFDLNDSLKLYLSDPTTIPTPEADPALAECDNDPDNFTNALIKSVLNPIVDAVAEAPEGIAQSAHLDTIQCLLKFVSNSNSTRRIMFTTLMIKLFFQVRARPSSTRAWSGA